MFCRVFFMILRLPGPTRPATPVPDPSRFRSGAAAAPSLDAAPDRARAIARADGVAEVMVIGGTEIYALALPRADRLYRSEEHTSELQSLMRTSNAVLCLKTQIKKIGSS